MLLLPPRELPRSSPTPCRSQVLPGRPGPAVQPRHSPYPHGSAGVRSGVGKAAVLCWAPQGQVGPLPRNSPSRGAGWAQLRAPGRSDFNGMWHHCRDEDPPLGRGPLGLAAMFSSRLSPPWAGQETPLLSRWPTRRQGEAGGGGEGPQPCPPFPSVRPWDALARSGRGHWPPADPQFWEGSCSEQARPGLDTPPAQSPRTQEEAASAAAQVEGLGHHGVWRSPGSASLKAEARGLPSLLPCGQALRSAPMLGPRGAVCESS